MEPNKFSSTFGYKLIYIFRINDKSHYGKLKIGDATIHTNLDKSQLLNNCQDLNEAAKNRINDYTRTAGIEYELLHTELAITKDGNVFKDNKVHDVLKRSNIKNFYFNTEKKQNEWFITDLNTAIEAIKAVKEGKSSLTADNVSFDKSPIVFRPEQEKAIKFTISNFKRNNETLWNAKMRFGKTLCALEVVKREKFKRTIIITHRPVVNDSWYEDFNKIFCEENTEYKYASKTLGEKLESLLDSDKPFVYFASIQDLRGSKKVGGNFEKDEQIFNTNWDLVVIDEAHEGTKTNLGEKTIEGVVKLDTEYTTKVLYLSGTPFNLINNFKEDQIYTWDYIMEQTAKLEWDKEHPGDSNPYADLPQLNIYTYKIDKLIPNYVDIEDSAFNFREFFRTWTGKIETDGKAMPSYAKIGDFIHKNDVNKFLNLLVSKNVYSNYPYSTEEYRDYFRHSLWMVPGVKEAKALSKLLREHSVFGSGAFKIVNVAGDGDDDKNYEETHFENALREVQNAIGDKPQDTYTITISCGRLTTGVSVKEWTAVFMLSGTYSTSASTYLQTIFRVQTPGSIGGKQKEKCYVFDFAPDRALKMVAEASNLSTRPGAVQGEKNKIGAFLNFCPVIGVEGSCMSRYDESVLLRKLKKAYAQRVVQNGFDDNKIYNDNLLKLDDIDIEKFSQLKKIIGASNPSKKINNIEINSQGFNDEEYEAIEEAKQKAKHELSEDEKRLLEDQKEKKKNANTAISILRGISIRIPLLIYGADIPIEQDIDCDNFVNIIDDKSWEEFMPKGVTKDLFKDFSKYYDKEIFIEAGRQIRISALHADTLPIKERVQRISQIFSMFRNPDKETVLTPWKTVNMHLGDCIGGYNFNTESEEPRFINRGQVTKDLFNNNNAKILEINSKTGLYALYCAYSIYMNRLLNYNKEDYSEEKNESFWKETLDKNLFIICKTKMSVQIVKRTLAGYKNYKINTLLLENIVEDLKNNNFNCINIIKDAESWNMKGDTMNFNAIVGNPPYQIGDGGGDGTSALPVYNLFVEEAKKIKSNYISMITPARWYSGGKGLDEFRSNMLSDEKISVIHDFPETSDIFSNVNIRGGICYFLWDNNHTGNCMVSNHKKDEISVIDRPLLEKNATTFIRYNKAISILRKVQALSEKTMDGKVSSRLPFGIPSNFSNYTLEKTDKYNVILYRSSRGSIKSINKKVFINEKEIQKNIEWKDKIKVLVSKASPGGDEYPHQIISEPILAETNSVCTETYLIVDFVKNKQQGKNLISYMKTRFFRFMLGLIKNTQNISKGVFAFVPVQSLNEEWTDEKLYDKYSLDEDEIKFIESMIRPM